MIVVLKQGVAEDKRDQLIHWLQDLGLRIHLSVGEYQTVLGLVGDTSQVDMDLVGSLEIVDSVKRVSEPFKCCNRKFHPEDMVVECEGVKIGGGNFAMIAGPCSVESEEQIVAVAKAVKAAGAQLLRGGAFKPRTSPYDFPGLKATGLELLKIARQETGLPFVTEIMSVADLPLFEDVDMLQVGARNMQNFDLLRELGKMDNDLIFVEFDKPLGWTEIEKKLEILQNACDTGDDELAREALRQVVPTYYRPEEINRDVDEDEDGRDVAV